VKNKFSNILVFSNYNANINRVFEDYCNGIKANCNNYHYIDYARLYLEKGKGGFENHIENYVAEHKIDLIFFIWWSCDLTFDIHFLERLSKTASQPKLVMNFFDTEYYFEAVDRYYAQVADLVILPDSLARYRYEHLNINAHTSFALFDGDYYKNTHEANKDIDVSFIGNLKNADRAEYASYLKAAGIKVQTYGVGSDNGFASFEEMVSIFNRSKINLNFTTLATSENYIVPLPSINQRIRQSKGRPLEIALCGGFILSQYAAGIEEMFKIGEEFDVFHSKEEMLEKIKFYLENEEKRILMAEKSYTRALSQYEVKAGFKIIFDKLEDLPSKQIFPLYIDDIFMRSYVSARLMYITRHLISGRFSLAFEEMVVIFKYRKISLSMAYFFAVKGVVFALLEKPKLYDKLKRIKSKIGMKVKY
jgi:spore maturation protein CgeB